MPMSPATLAYLGYCLWLAAGLTDFILHRREHLARTSGIAESSLHLVQLALIGAGVCAWLYLQPNANVRLLWVILALVHAAVGYADTRVAFPRRRIGPLEQHVHSVLDMAPWIALLVLMAQYHGVGSPGWSLRQPAASLALQSAVLLPALLLAGLPALLEFRGAWKAARPPQHQLR